MTDSTQSIIRSILKIGAGSLIAKGIMDDSTATIIISGILALIGVVWGVFHRSTAQSVPINQGPLMLLGLVTASVLALGSGCAYVKVYDKERQSGFSSVMPAWPWQDSTAVIERMQISSKSN